ncbi:MAG: hypothetical protein JWN04_2016 [Myxococcaceae bacterium]|nr:hypothetical protein [Myxococcaceae bacterium]
MRVSNAWLWLLVALQIAIPSSYYLMRDDADDERFAWRMFSTVRLQRCEVDAYQTHSDGVLRPVDVPHTLHASWIRSLERGRAHVIEQFLALRCRQPGVTASSLDRRCKSASGRALPSIAYRYDCARAQLEGAP